MKMQIGLWIDHRRAVIVRLADGRQAVEIIESNMEKHIRPTGGARSKLPYGPQDVMKENGRERKFMLHLVHWYDIVAGKLISADELFVFGPGPGKNEFCKQIEGTALSFKLVGMETVDRMTTRQIAAKVRGHFIKPEHPVAL
jgi:hypothetical protein